MSIETEINMDYLIPSLRLQLGDINSESYRYTDAWLRTALVNGVKFLQKWWDNRYLIDTDYDVYRNTAITFAFPSPPIIQTQDERPIILASSIVIKEGSLEASSWNTGSWKDAEIAYSNIEGGKMKDSSLARDWDELTDLLKPPQKRLAHTKKGSLPGYLDNEYDRKLGSF